MTDPVSDAMCTMKADTAGTNEPSASSQHTPLGTLMHFLLIDALFGHFVWRNTLIAK